MKIEEYIKYNSKYIGYRVMIAPDIPMKKMNNCIKYITDSGLEDYVIAYGDATVFNKGKIGFAFTGENLYFSNEKGNRINLSLKEIKGATYLKKKKTREDDIFQVGDIIEITMRDNNTFYMEGCLVGFNCSAITNMLNGITNLVNLGEIPKATKQNIYLSELDDYYKLLYIKILCNYAYLGDSLIDSKEYSIIQNIVVRIGLEGNERNILRKYMAGINNKEKTGDLLYKLKNYLDYGSYDIVKYSIMQDVLYLHSISYPNRLWTEDGFIGSLINNLKLDYQQIELMEYAIDLNKQMISDDENIINLQSKVDQMIKNAIYLRVPLMTLYCSGSVYNIDTYRKIFNGNEKAKLSLEKQREFMLQAVIKNTQLTINNLVSDMNSISEQLIEEIQKGETSSIKIKKLSTLLSILSRGAEEISNKSKETEIRILYSKLPSTLDISRLDKIRKEKSYDIQCNTILKFYIIDERTQVRILKDNIDIKDLNRLVDIFEEISY